MSNKTEFAELLCRIYSHFGGIVLVAVTGDRLWIQRAGYDDHVIDLPAVFEVVPPKLPPEHLPEEARDGLTTRRHLQKQPAIWPLLVHGEIVSVEDFEQRCRDAFSRVRTRWWHAFFTPKVIAAAPWGDFSPRKRTMLDSLKRAGCRQVYLVDPIMAVSIGGQISVVDAKASGVLLVENDYTEFGVVGYADILCHRMMSLGCDDLLGPDDPQLDKMALLIGETLENLRDTQLEHLAQAGIVLMGNGASLPWLAEAISQRLSLDVRVHAVNPHPALVGLRTYAENLDEWADMLEALSKRKR